MAAKSEARDEKAPPNLTVDGAVRVVEGVQNCRDLGACLWVPASRRGESVKDVINYWIATDPFPSWRRLICALYASGDKGIADSVRHYAEPLADSTLTVQNVTRALRGMPYDSDFSNDLGVPGTILLDIERRYSTDDQRNLAVVEYYLHYVPGASWNHLAGKLYYYYLFEEEGALQQVQRYVQRPAESTLTPTNLCNALEEVKNWEGLGEWLNIPYSKLQQIAEQHRDSAEAKEEMLKVFLAQHPAPSWATVTEALYRMGPYEEKSHHVLQEVRRLYGTGSEESKRLFNKAMKGGYVETVAVKVVITGAAGSGKTCSQEVIIGRPPPKRRISTPVAQRPVKLSRAQANPSDWDILTDESIQDAIAEIIQSLGIELPAPVQAEPSTTAGETNQENVESKSTPTRTSGAETKQLPTSQPMSDHQRLHPSTPEEEDTPTVKTVPLAFSVEQKLLKLIDKASASGKIPRFEWVYFVDSGGQPQFHEILPVFLKGASICIYVQKLSERLDEHPVIEYYDDNGLVGKSYRAMYTNEQIFQHCTRTMQSHRSKAGKGEAPKILVLGTHADLEHQCSETRQAKNRKLLEILQPSFSDDIVYYGEDQKQIIFPLNAKEPGEAERQIAEQIRGLIMCKGAHVPNKVPLCWYVLDQALQEMARKQRRAVLSKDECFAAASQLHLDYKSFMAALEYLDELNIISYYRNVLPEVVFSDIQVVLDKATELVKFSHQLMKEPKAGVAFKGELQKFRDYGFVTVDLLSQFKSHFVPGLFTATELVKLFRELLLLADLNDREFFMPSLLRKLDWEEVDCHRASGSSATAPLVVEFHDGPLLAMFCSLITYLLSDRNRHPKPWKLLLKSGAPKCVFRNCIQFSIPGYPGCVSLIDTFSFFEAHTLAPADLHPQLCPIIRAAVFEGLKRASTVIGYNNSLPIHAVICPCKRGKRHSAILSDAKRRWICSEDCTRYGPLEESHTVWLGVQAEEMPLQDSNPVSEPISGIPIPLTGPHRKKLKLQAEKVSLQGSNPVTTSHEPISGSPAGTSHIADTLDEGDQFDITTYLMPLDRATVYVLGQALGLTQRKVKVMTESDTFLDEVIAAWLRREDLVEKRGMPTWRTLVKALRHPRIGQNGLANDISRDKGL